MGLLLGFFMVSTLHMYVCQCLMCFYATPGLYNALVYVACTGTYYRLELHP